MRTLLGTAAAVALAVSLAACGNQQTQTVTGPDGSKSTVTTSNDGAAYKIESKGPEGAGSMVIGAGAQWPADAPAVFQAYPGAVVTTSVSSTQGGETSSMVTFTSKDPVEKVLEFYKSRLVSAGLQSQSMTDANGMKMFGGTTKDGLNFSLMVSPQEGETTGSITYGKPKS